MIRHLSIRLSEGSRHTTYTVDLEDIAIECDVWVTTKYDGCDGAGAPLYLHTLDVSPTHVTFKLCPNLRHRFPIEAFPLAMHDVFAAWAGEHCEDAKSEIVNYVF